MTTTSTEPCPWWRDRRLLLLVIVTVVLRLVLEGLWPMESCVRDECMYLFTAERMADGQGMTPSNGWIWAPAHVFLLAVMDKLTFGYSPVLKVPQAMFCGVAAVTLFRIGQRVASDRAALASAWIYALHPTIVFFATRLWSETIYATLLLLALLGLLKARDGAPGRAALTGALVGLCVLLRGVATYMLPIFVLGLLWARWRERRAWGQGLVLAITAMLVVAPYSAYATHKFGTFIISDRTMGQMMWLGNNDFPPITFDFGNGQLNQRSYNGYAKQGREHCAPKEQPVERDLCETAAGKAWIRDNPETFARRVPLRLAQLFNPNSFLTRHLRHGGWKNLPDAIDEILCVAVVLASFLTVLGSALGAWSRRLGAYALVVGLTTAYHLAAVGALAGLSRYRVPLDVIWLPFAGVFLAAPLATLRTLLHPWWRLLGALITIGVLLWLMLWFLPAGFPWWKTEYPLWAGWFE